MLHMLLHVTFDESAELIPVYLLCYLPFLLLFAMFATAIVMQSASMNILDKL